MSKKVQVFTHTDLDGIISPVVLENVMKIAEPHTQHDFSVTYCETGSYGTIDAEIQAFMEAEKVVDAIYITDISPTMETAERLHAYCQARDSDWYILDHHQTALPLMERFPEHAVILMQDKATGLQHAGVSLAFHAFTGKMPEEVMGASETAPLHAIAELAAIVRSWDTWAWAKDPADHWKEQARRFELLRTSLGRERFLARFDKGTYAPVISEAEGMLLDVLDAQEKRYIADKVTKARFGSLEQAGETYTFAFVTAEQHKSTLGNALSRLEVDGAQVDLAIIFDHGRLSLRSSKPGIDASLIAKSFFNGGGHPMASGGELPGFDALHAVEKHLLAVPEKAVSQEEQERSYQQCVERVLGNGSAAYVDFLLHCTEVDPENEAERLARKEFIGNWHDEFKSDIEEGDKKRLAAIRKYD